MGVAVAIRADASLLIGTGHVMRCLTLARALRENGHEVVFISRELEGNLCDHIAKQGFPIVYLPRPGEAMHEPGWLGVSWETDAQQTRKALCGFSGRPAWLVVDHYGLDVRWESAVRPLVGRVLAVDDLADRKHACDLLLDANLGRDPRDYAGLVPEACRLLIGPRFALLRREFAEWRERSLDRLRWPLRHVLISMGGVDRSDATSEVLDVLGECPQMAEADITVIMGQHSPWLQKVKDRAAHMRSAKVYVNVNNMAELMADSDLAIGASGSSSWERCCLGLPSLTVILADNQRLGARALDASGAQLSVGVQAGMAERLSEQLGRLDRNAILSMSESASALVDGFGAQRVLESMNV